MSRILSIGTALPENVLTQSEVKRFARDIFGDAFKDSERLLGVYDNAEIETRHFCVPLDWFASEQTFKQKNDLYIHHAIELSRRAIERALERRGLDYGEIDYIIFVSTTGVATPSIDAHLLQGLPFRRDVKRLPLWGLGCAGGASSLARAMEITQADPDANVLVVVVELCGLTFMRNDLTKSALIATSLFADGAAAVIVGGYQSSYPHTTEYPSLLASATRTLPDSLDVMGWDVGDAGFKIVISRDIPAIVRTFMRESIEEFLTLHGLRTDEIEHFVAHPGGAKVLEAYIDSLSLAPDKLRHTREILRTCGNMSAVSVLFVLERFIDEIASRADDDASTDAYGLLCALGPGFASEVLLLEWQG